MKHLRFYFDCHHPQALAGFGQLPQCLQGLSVECSYLPVQAAHTPAGDALLRLAWACTAAGRTPSRWVCEQVLNQAQRLSEPPAHDAAALVARREAGSAEVEADLCAARAELSAGLGPDGAALADGWALWLEADAVAARGDGGTGADVPAGAWFLGEAGLRALTAGLASPDKP